MPFFTAIKLSTIKFSKLVVKILFFIDFLFGMG